MIRTPLPFELKGRGKHFCPDLPILRANRIFVWTWAGPGLPSWKITFSAATGRTQSSLYVGCLPKITLNIHTHTHSRNLVQVRVYSTLPRPDDTKPGLGEGHKCFSKCSGPACFQPQRGEDFHLLPPSFSPAALSAGWPPPCLLAMLLW